MGFLDKAKATAEQAAQRVQEGVDDVQAKRDLSQLYGELGRVAYALVKRGEISHPELTPLVDRVSGHEGEGTPSAAPPAGPSASAPPAAGSQMPG